MKKTNMLMAMAIGLTSMQIPHNAQADNSGCSIQYENGACYNGENDVMSSYDGGGSVSYYGGSVGGSAGGSSSGGGSTQASVSPAIFTTWSGVVAWCLARGITAQAIAAAWNSAGAYGVQQLIQNSLGVTVMLDDSAEVGAATWAAETVIATTVSTAMSFVGGMFTGILERANPSIFGSGNRGQVQF